MRERLLRRIPRRFDVELAVCGMFRNEGRYLEEWIAFHRAQGVERFYLYDNRSTDGWSSSADDVEVKDWPDHPGQFSAYSDCLDRHGQDTHWIAFLDVDEFLFSPTARTLPEVLVDFRRASGVCANWRVYGTSGRREPAKLVTQAYVWRARDEHLLNRTVKSVVQPKFTKPWPDTPHFFRHYGKAVAEDGRRVHGPFRRPPTVELLRVNHYVTRSLSEWRLKMRRDRADTGEPHPEPLMPPDEVWDPVLAQPPFSTWSAQTGADVVFD